jgi:hypothetical protein
LYFLANKGMYGIPNPIILPTLNRRELAESPLIVPSSKGEACGLGHWEVVACDGDERVQSPGRLSMKAVVTPTDNPSLEVFKYATDMLRNAGIRSLARNLTLSLLASDAKMVFVHDIVQHNVAILLGST